MKHFIWMLCGIFISGLLLGSLSACGAGSFGVTVVTTDQPSQIETDEPEPGAMPEAAVQPGEASPEESAAPEAASEASPSQEELSPSEQYAASAQETRRLYGAVLWDAYLKGVLPDGSQLDWSANDLETAAQNTFAVLDVDQDGEEELILRWTTAVMAGMRGIVYGVQNGEVYEELSEFPDLTFYNSNIAEAGWSHNQGWAGRFWPYNLYHYDDSTGVYELAGAVDAWDRALFEDDETLSAAFPADVDADGDGLVYYILTGEWYLNDRAPENSLPKLWGVDPVDGPDLERWRQSYLNGAEPTGISWQKLTEENIAALGAPKPDVTYPEPKG